MKELNEFIIPSDLRPFCDEILDSFTLDLSKHEYYVRIFRQRFYYGCCLDTLCEVTGFSLGDLEKLLNELLFKVLIFALRKLLIDFVRR